MYFSKDADAVPHLRITLDPLGLDPGMSTQPPTRILVLGTDMEETRPLGWLEDHRDRQKG